ncbi:hypothetical protein V0288_12520 [Pannus brasiliensis CCIBt3594]|uniref:DUF3137 domain-containing protein n=1 Tax=Pannus brasiliensis CCIBt3594 TaxID=1427578 RepID=A0AAW9QSC7_9CHRO
MQGFLVISLVIIVIAGFVGFVIYVNKKRREDLQALARQLNLHFFFDGEENLGLFLANFDFFTQGRNRQIRNLIRGNITRQGKTYSISIFDYTYTIGHPDNTDTFVQTVLFFYDESLNVPTFSLRPEHIFDKLGNVFGFEDINFAEFPDFSQRYRLQSNQEGEVRSLFQANLIKFYEKHKICTEARGSYVLIFPAGDSMNRSRRVRVEGTRTFTESRLLPPEEIRSYLNIGVQLLKLLNQTRA